MAEQEPPDSIDVGSESQVKRRKLSAKLSREREIAEMKEILVTLGGRAVMWRILAICKIYDAPPTHPQDTFRHIGRQDVGRELQKELFTCDFGAYMLMWQEAEERRVDGEKKDG